jgi:hypothetical protein
MAQPIPLLVRLDGHPSDDGKTVIVQGRLADKGHVLFAVEPDKIAWMIFMLTKWAREAALKADWTDQPIGQQDDTGPRIRPSQCGLVHVDGSAHVHLAIDIGPVRLRFELPKSSARELGLALQAASAPEGRSH